MQKLNFKHLLYFHTVASEGSVTRAAEKLNVTPQTVSGQLATFENHIDSPLFERRGKQLQLNELGKLTMRYADDIFDLGTQLSRHLVSKEVGTSPSFHVGIVDAIPKVMAFDMLNDCFDMTEPFKLECHEGDLLSLLGDLSINKLDLILSDQPLPTGVSVRAKSHYLGQSGITFFASKKSKGQYSGEFPDCLNGAPFLMPSVNSAQNQNLEAWFEKHKVVPKIVAEFDDTALLKFFGQVGRGAFCVSSGIEADILEQFTVEVIGRTQDLADRYYAISPERKFKHPATEQIMLSATRLLEVDH